MDSPDLGHQQLDLKNISTLEMIHGRYHHLNSK